MKKNRMLLIILSVMMIMAALCQGAGAASASGEVSMPFTDVKAGAYYYEPVLWAVEKGVTSGTSETTFSPDQTCTRGQVVTFLWRAAGKPDPTIKENPFKDVKSDAYYYKAVQWAVEEGITSGMSKTEFEPNSPCTRGQVVTFQWRSNGKPDPKSDTNPFTDVKNSAYYHSAVLWAVEKKITNGVGATSFAPDDVCTRGQIVTFLYRQDKIIETITFGSYEQDNDLTNGKEPIEWLVLKKENGKALLLSKYGLDCQSYNQTYTEVTWETCTLRQWLNSTFLDEAFSSSQKSQILTTTIPNPDTYVGYDSSYDHVVNNTGEGITRLEYHVSGGNATQDQVFLLSIDEAKSLLGYERQILSNTNIEFYVGYPNMLASATAYAKANGARASLYFNTIEGEATCWWWLRSPGNYSILASNIFDDGSVLSENLVHSFGGAVRPALWVNLES